MLREIMGRGTFHGRNMFQIYMIASENFKHY